VDINASDKIDFWMFYIAKMVHPNMIIVMISIAVLLSKGNCNTGVDCEVGHFFNHWYKVVHNADSRSHCVKLCRADSVCRSVNYRPDERRCTLNKKSKFTQPDSFDDDLIWEYCTVWPCEEHRYLQHYYKTLAVSKQCSSMKDCIQECQKEPDLCRSVSYYEAASWCILSTQTLLTRSDRYRDNMYQYCTIVECNIAFCARCVEDNADMCETCEADHALSTSGKCQVNTENEVKCEYGHWLEQPTKYIRNVVTLTACIDLCTEESNFTCRSVSHWYGNECRLSVHTKYTRPDLYEAGNFSDYCTVVAAEWSLYHQWQSGESAICSDTPEQECSYQVEGLEACQQLCWDTAACTRINFCPLGADCTSGLNRCCLLGCSEDHVIFSDMFKGWDSWSLTRL